MPRMRSNALIYRETKARQPLSQTKTCQKTCHHKKYPVNELGRYLVLVKFVQVVPFLPKRKKPFETLLLGEMCHTAKLAFASLSQSGTQSRLRINRVLLTLDPLLLVLAFRLNNRTRRARLGTITAELINSFKHDLAGCVSQDKEH